LLDLPDEIFKETKESKIKSSGAEEILFVKDEAEQLQLANKIIVNNLPVLKIILNKFV
jgi:hypothetical protein